MLKQQGLYIERISWAERVFVPTGENQAAVLTRLLASKPVVDVFEKGAAKEEGDTPSFSRTEQKQTKTAPEREEAKYIKRGANINGAPITVNEANRGKTNALERAISRGGDLITITPVAAPSAPAGEVPDNATGGKGQRGNDAGGNGAASWRAAENIAGLFGKQVIPILADGDFAINGVVNRKEDPNSIFIDVRTSVPSHVVMGHELSHHIETDAPEIYAELMDAISGLLKGHREYRATYGISANTSDNAVNKEMVGDLLGDSFTHPEFWDLVGEQNPSLLRDLASTVTKWLNHLILKATGKGYASERWVTDAREARKILAKAVARYAIGNTGKFSADNKGIRFSRTAPSFTQRIEQSGELGERFADLMQSQKSFNGWWHKTVGTQYHKAQVDSDFRKVFDAGQSYISGVSAFVNDAADEAQDLLPRLDSFADVMKKRVKAEDLRAVAGAVFTGTLTDEKVYTDAELRDQFELNDVQIGLYRQFRAAIDRSLDDLTKTDILRVAGKNGEAVTDATLGAETLHDAATLLSRHLRDLGDKDTADRVWEALMA